jgi:type II secretory pathway pseudopilin PulG
MRTARNNEGFALVTAIAVLTVILGLGLGLAFLTDSQQKAASRSQASEAAFKVAEAALNAQIGQLSHSWPEKEKQVEFPERCTAATSTETNGCPTTESLKIGYPSSSTTCPAGAQKDAWGSPLTNTWTTYVRDELPVGGQIFNSTEEATAPAFAKDGKVWVRSVGVVQCRMVVLVALVSPQIVTIPFPQTAIAGNWFATSNKGNKIIVNTKGKSSESGGIGMRCGGRTKENCEEFREGQIQPYVKVPPSPEHTLTAAQLEALKIAAKAANTYFPPGKCPESAKQASGLVYVEGPCTIGFKGNEVVNSAEKPGFFVLVNGTFELSMNAEFYGTVYAINAQKSAELVVNLHGRSKLTGSIVVDGSGGIGFGSSGGGGKKEEEEENENFVYSNTAIFELKAFAGASATRNSFRILPVSQ